MLTPDTPYLSPFDRLQLAKQHNKKLNFELGVVTSERDEARHLLRQANDALQQLLQANKQERLALKKEAELKQLRQQLADANNTIDHLRKANRQYRMQIKSDERRAA